VRGTLLDPAFGGLSGRYPTGQGIILFEARGSPQRGLAYLSRCNSDWFCHSSDVLVAGGGSTLVAQEGGGSGVAGLGTQKAGPRARRGLGAWGLGTAARRRLGVQRQRCCTGAGRRGGALAAQGRQQGLCTRRKAGQCAVLDRGVMQWRRTRWRRRLQKTRCSRGTGDGTHD
jgi:hypothetical protein